MLVILAALTLQAFSPPDPVLTRGEVQNWTAPEAGTRILSPTVAATVIDGKVWRAGPPGHFGGRWWTAAAPSGPGRCRRLAYDAWISPTNVHDNAPTATLSPRVDTLTQYAPSYPDPATPERCGQLEGWISLRSEDDEADRLRMLDRLIAVVTEAAGEAPLSFGLTIACGEHTRGPCPDARAALRDIPLDSLYHIGRARLARGEPVPTNGAPIEVSLGPAEGYNSWRIRIDDNGQTPQITIDRVMAIYH